MSNFLRQVSVDAWVNPDHVALVRITRSYGGALDPEVTIYVSGSSDPLVIQDDHSNVLAYLSGRKEYQDA